MVLSIGATHQSHASIPIGATHRLDATRFRHLLQDSSLTIPIGATHRDSNRCHPPIGRYPIQAFAAVPAFQHSNRCHPPISCQHSIVNRCHPPISCQHSIGATHRLDATRFRHLLQGSSLRIPIGATHRSHASIPIAVNRCHHRYPARAGRPCHEVTSPRPTDHEQGCCQSVPPTNLMPAFQLLSIGATFAIQHGRDARATRGRLRAQLTTRIPIFGVDDYSRSFQATMAVPSGDRPRPFPLGAR